MCRCRVTYDICMTDGRREDYVAIERGQVGWWVEPDPYFCPHPHRKQKEVVDLACKWAVSSLPSALHHGTALDTSGRQNKRRDGAAGGQFLCAMKNDKQL